MWERATGRFESPAATPNENIDEDRLEAILEPGLEIMEPKIMSKELEHIKNHTKIPERLNF